ncbi:MAG: nitronate monooxygenase [Halieaceae bacterium]|nr:nitronate monooxygenase [Halieaceae bacterium]
MNRVLQHLGSRYPIIQSPMGWIARAQLASAVCNAGGFGIIETSSGETENCQREIRAMADLTDQPFGVNLPLLFLRDDTMVRFVVEQGVRFVTTSAGNPAKFIGMLKEAGTTVYHSVATVRSAMKAVECGVDGLIVEGTEGGGFKNPDPVGLLVLLQAIRRRCDIPMVAAGGISDGIGMAAAFAAGAEGIQMGTRFVSAEESPVHANFKRAIIEAGDTDTWLVNNANLPPVRARKSETTAALREGADGSAILASIQDLYFGGDMEASVALIGQSAGLIEEVEPVAAIIERTVKQFFDVQEESARRAAARSF